MSASSTMMMRPSLGRPSPLWRVAVAGCALTLALLLLFQPLLCVAHCFLYTHPASAHASGNEPFLCHMAPSPDTGPLLVPAFWPGVLPALIMLVVTVISLHLPASAPFSLLAHPWEPPFPPPRRIVA